MQKQKIFLIDAIGALLSIGGLCFLYFFHTLFGMPQTVICSFTCVAIILCCSSFVCYLVNPIKWRIFLGIIATVNIGYCVYTVYRLIDLGNSITLLGYLYFIIELTVIFVLAIYELRLSTGLNKGSI
jgi:hypothetical protein